MKRVSVLVLAIATMALLPSSGLAARSTTAPGYNYTIKVTITANGVTLSSSDAKRGWLLHFLVTNKTSTPHTFSVGGMSSKTLAPGSTGKIGAYAEDRGQFKYYVDKSLKGYFQVV